MSIRKAYDHLQALGEAGLADVIRKAYTVDDFAFTNLNHNPDVECQNFLEEVEPSCTARQLETLNKLVSRFRYSFILWLDYRNRAIHETNRPDPTLNFSGKKVPCYTTGTIPYGNGSKRKRIVSFTIPPEYVLTTLKNCLTHFRKEWESGAFDYEAMVEEKLDMEP